MDADDVSTPGDDAALRDLQWDNDLLETGTAHETATGEGRASPSSTPGST
ncbi:hypothetical protein ACFQRB_00415 [Halobaculum litoreum]|uniref:Uncharacterized protein n=1 Tax=Halobaculum litoreum TaxID=3031998 RepID=A0ABD5XPM4_9EURY